MTLTTPRGIYRVEEWQDRPDGAVDAIVSYRPHGATSEEKRFAGYRCASDGWHVLNAGWSRLYNARQGVTDAPVGTVLDRAELVALLAVALPVQAAS